jgi:Rrf2 family protein
MTSAPMSANSIPAYGPGPIPANSTTVSPLSGPGLVLANECSLRREGVALNDLSRASQSRRFSSVMMGNMQISAKADYAVRAMLELAAHGPELVKAELLITHQGMPRKFVETILAELRRAGLIHSQRGADGGYSLADKPSKITLGSIIRAVDGPLAEVRGLRPNETSYEGAAQHLPDVWVAVRASLRKVLDETTLAQVLEGTLPRHVKKMLDAPDAYLPR